MPTLTLTNGASLNAALDVQGGTALARADLKQILTSDARIFGLLHQPLDQCTFTSISMGATFTSPDLLSNEIAVNAVSGVNCGLKVIKHAEGLLFPDDGFTARIPVGPNQAWLGFELDLTCGFQLGVQQGAFGVTVSASTRSSACTWTLFSVAAPPLPTLLSALPVCLSDYSLPASAADLRRQPADTVHTAEISGSVTASVSVEQLFTPNPLASAELGFHQTASIQPCVTAVLGSSITITGDFVLRAYKVTEALLRIGMYKQRGVNLAVTLEAAAGMGGDIGATDVLSGVLNAVMPGLNLQAAGLTGTTAAELNAVIHTSLSRSLSAQLNATCSAELADEAALLYDVRLDEGDPAQTDTALEQALEGDWKAVHLLQNATCLRNIAVETISQKRAISFNLFGFYNATSVMEYVKRSTILVDDSGQLSMIDRVDTSRISTSTSPHASDPAKLRRALLQDFLCTATYAAVCGKLQLQLTALQSYFDYKQNMSSSEMLENVRLGRALGVLPPGALDAVIANAQAFSHAAVAVTVRYDDSALMSLFYEDPVMRTPRSQPDIESTGRQVMEALLDPRDNADTLRVLQDEAIWARMDDMGNSAGFHTIPGLNTLAPAVLADVIDDWMTIRWWADALTRVAAPLASTLLAIEKVDGGDPRQDPGFLKARSQLANALGAVTRSGGGGDVRGWPTAAIFALSGRKAQVTMDLTWSGQTHHFVS